MRKAAVEEELEQADLPGMERPRVPAIEKAAKEYVKTRDSWQSLGLEMAELKEKLVALMKEHGLETYETKDGRMVEHDVTEVEKLSVTKIKKPKEDD